jgi:hypothetical protein
MFVGVLKIRERRIDGAGKSIRRGLAEVKKSSLGRVVRYWEGSFGCVSRDACSILSVAKSMSTGSQSRIQSVLERKHLEQVARRVRAKIGKSFGPEQACWQLVGPGGQRRPRFLSILDAGDGSRLYYD